MTVFHIEKQVLPASFWLLLLMVCVRFSLGVRLACVPSAGISQVIDDRTFPMLILSSKAGTQTEPTILVLALSHPPALS